MTKVTEPCSICGKDFVINVVDGKIKTKGIYHARIPKRYFDGWVYKVERIEDLEKNKLKPIFKNKFWKVVGYTKIQRTILYFFIHNIYEVKKWDYWECLRCTKKANGKKKY